MDLCCFSATGNSRRAADLARQICGNTDLFFAVFPVHAQTVPDLFRARLEALPPGSGPACVICTFGGVNPGSALADCAAILAGKGYSVIAAAQLPDRHSYDRAVPAGRLDLPRRWREDELEEFLRAVRKKVAHDPSPVQLPRKNSLGKHLPQPLLATLGTCYPASAPDLCTHCGQCAAVCPTGAALGDKRACIRCAACVDACPVHARVLRFRAPVTRWYLERNIRRAKEPEFYL